MKPTIFAAMRPNNFGLLKKIYDTDKFDFVIYHPKVEKKFIENSMGFESFQRYFNQDVIQKSNQEFLKIVPQWEGLLKNQKFHEEFAIGNRQYFDLIKNDLNALFIDQAYISIVIIEAFKNLYYQKNLCLVLVWTDVIHETKTLTYIAKRHNVKVLHVTHSGMGLFTTGYTETKIYSDRIALFGQHLKEQIRIKNGPVEKVIITGDTEKDKFFNGSITFDKEKICRELGLNPKSKIIFFGSTWTGPFPFSCIWKNYQELTIKEFLKSFGKLQKEEPSLQLAIKLHPTEYGQSKYYERLAHEAGVKNYRIFESHLNELLYICDLYTGFRSSIIIEALIFNKPVLLFHFYEISDEKFFEGLAIKWVSKPEDIYETMKTYLYDEKAINDLKKLIPKSIEYFNYKSDGQATKRVIDLICEMAEETLSKPVKERIIDYQTRTDSHDSRILNSIDFRGKKILFINSMKNLDMDELTKRKGDSILYFVEQRSPSLTPSHQGRENALSTRGRGLGRRDFNRQNIHYLDLKNESIHTLSLKQISFDYIVFKNSLETLYDPWSWIKDMHPYLKEDGKVLIEFANIRNLGIFSSIVNGYFTYAGSEILTFDKIRYFTSADLAIQVTNAGFKLLDCQYFLDESIKDAPSVNPSENIHYNFKGENFSVNNIPGNSLFEMYCRNILLTFQKNNASNNFVSPLNLPKPDNYFENPRIDLIEMVDEMPELILEINCGSGTTCQAIKNRYPDCKTIGIDIDEETIKKAAKVIDKAIAADVEKVELSEIGIKEESLDYIFYGEVLEHLRDPWTVLKRHKKYLKQDGKIIASIPNIRHQSVLLPLMFGRWTYTASGILDSTHLRFFTLKEIKRLFRSAGLYIYDIKGNPNVKPDDLKIPKEQISVSFNLQDLILQNIPREEVPEFFTIQFRIKAGKEGKNLLI